MSDQDITEAGTAAVFHAWPGSKCQRSTSSLSREQYENQTTTRKTFSGPRDILSVPASCVSGASVKVVRKYEIEAFVALLPEARTALNVIGAHL
jgi:hypothetical protein